MVIRKLVINRYAGMGEMLQASWSVQGCISMRLGQMAIQQSGKWYY